MASAAPSVPCVAAAHGLRLAMARQPLPLIARARVIRRVGLTLLALIAGEAALVHGVVPPPLVRTVPVGQGPTALALDQRTHRVFVANSDDNTVSVLDADRGTLLRTVAVGRYPDAVAVDARTGRAFVANLSDATVSVLDARGGAVLRTVRVGLGARAVAVAERDSRIVVANRGGDGVSILDARSGTVVRTISVSAQPVEVVGVAVDPTTGHAFVTSAVGRSPSSLGGSHGWAGRVTLLDGRSGRILRTMVVHGAPNPVALDTHTGRTFVSSARGVVSVLDTPTGRQLRTVGVGPDPDAPVVDERSGRVFVANGGDGTVTILDARSGAVRGTVVVGGNPGPAAVDERRGHVFVLDAPSDADGCVRVLDAGTGAVLRTIRVGMGPLAVAVDERTGYAFVINYGGTMRASAPWWEHDVQWLRRWLPWLPQQAPPLRTIPGSLTVLDLSRL